MHNRGKRCIGLLAILFSFAHIVSTLLAELPAPSQIKRLVLSFGGRGYLLFNICEYSELGYVFQIDEPCDDPSFLEDSHRRQEPELGFQGSNLLRA